MNLNNQELWKKSTPHRWVTGIFGAFFTCIAVLIPVASDLSAWSVLATLVVGILGVQAMLAGWKNKEAWVMKIGPMP